jgi:hypothetical protein
MNEHHPAGPNQQMLAGFSGHDTSAPLATSLRPTWMRSLLDRRPAGRWEAAKAKRHDRVG